MIGTTVSRYRLVGHLAKGGMGEVYEAEDPVFPRTVALKFVSSEAVEDPRIRERFHREIQALSSLNHRNICVVYDAGEFEGRPYLVMERLEGRTLAEELARTPLEINELLSIGIQVCEGLGAAHAQGIIHRDIKPSNIMVTAGSQVKILDFGLAKIRACEPSCDDSSASTAEPLTDRNALVGTVPYMSPEQALGKPLDARCDLFSLGVVLYELATGHHPFRGENLAAVCDALIHRQPAPAVRFNPALPLDFDGLLGKAMQKDPQHRFQSAADFAAELRRIRHDLEVSSAPRPEPASRARRRSGAWIRYALLSIAAILVLVLGVPEGVQWISDRLGRATIEGATTTAVMPFELIGADASQQQDFCEGLARDLTILLQQLDGSGPRLTVSSYQLVKDLKLDDLYRERGVELALQGSLSQEGDGIVIRLNLIDTRSGAVAGSERIEGSRLDRNSLVRRVEQAVLRLLSLQLSPGSRNVLAAEALEEAPDLRGVLLEAQGLLERYDDPAHIRQAIGKFSQVIKLAPEYAPARSGLAMAYATLYRHDPRPELVVQASESARQALRYDPDDPRGHLAWGLVLLEFGRYDEALPEFDRALQLSPEMSEVWSQKATALAALGRVDEAETAYRKAIALRPNYWAGYHELGSFYLRFGRYEDALREFEHVQSILPESVTARDNIAVVHLTLQHPSVAQAVLEQSLQMQKSLHIPPTFHTYDLLGTSFFQQQDFEGAAENYKKALDLDESHAFTWGNLGSCYSQLGRTVDARDCYAKAAGLVRKRVEVNPNDATATLDLADYLIQAGDREQGRFYLGEALKLPASQSDPELMFVAAQAFEELGDRDRAIDWVLRALAAGFPRARLEDSPSMKDLVGDPQFRHRLEEVGGPTKPDGHANNVQGREKEWK
ncbi:MAG: tetratricopeptide repeat protein [Acidobacteriota bacterium]